MRIYLLELRLSHLGAVRFLIHRKKGESLGGDGESGSPLQRVQIGGAQVPEGTIKQP